MDTGGNGKMNLLKKQQQKNTGKWASEAGNISRAWQFATSACDSDSIFEQQYGYRL